MRSATQTQAQTQTQTVHYDSKGRRVQKHVVSTREHSMLLSLPLAMLTTVALTITAIAYALGHM